MNESVTLFAASCLFVNFACLWAAISFFVFLCLKMSLKKLWFRVQIKKTKTLKNSILFLNSLSSVRSHVANAIICMLQCISNGELKINEWNNLNSQNCIFVWIKNSQCKIGQWILHSCKSTQEENIYAFSKCRNQVTRNRF